MHRRRFLQSAAILPIAAHAQTQQSAAPPRPLSRAPHFGDGRDWWFERRFGMFVHWGIYAIHGLHQQEQWRYRVPRAEYVKLQQQWNPVKYDPNAWLDLAAEAGMKYICLTTKHHDGFCLWNTKQTGYNTVNKQIGRDVLEMFGGEADVFH